MRFLVVGDAPNQSTGLARIARDICTLLRMGDHEVAQLGWGYDGSPQPWACYGIADGDNWGQEDIRTVVSWVKPAVIFTVWDPARCFPITTEIAKMQPDVPRLWGYFAIDGHTARGGFGAYAAAALDSYERILAYGLYGATVLRRVTNRPIAYLPHLLGPAFTQPTKGRPELWFREGLTLGCVASNQPRKDLGLVFAVAASLGANLWLHTDFQVKHWSIPQLADEYGFDPSRCIVTEVLSDDELALRYRACDITLAPGLGEGFGYPIVESLACGVQVVHGSYGGGAELLPHGWLVEPVAWRVEGPFVLQRPVFEPGTWVRKVEALLRQKQELGEQTMEAYCRGLVAHLRWENLAGWWQAWLRG